MPTYYLTPMTAAEIHAAATLLHWIASCRKVKFATEDGETRTAHVRSIHWEQGREDIRETEVRLTMSTGWDDYWSGAEIIKMIRNHEMVPTK